MKKELREKALAAFKKKYNELPADHGFPVIRERHDGVYFAKSTDDWHNFVKEQKFINGLFTFIFFAIASIAAIVMADFLVVNNHRLLLVALAAYCILLIFVAVVVSSRKPTKKVMTDGKEILFYNVLENKIYIIAL